MLLLLLLACLCRIEGELSWMLVLAKEWCWGRRKDWRGAFAMDGRGAEFRVSEGRKKKGKAMMIKEWLGFRERFVCTCCSWLLLVWRLGSVPPA